jgi:hypothetical protein
MEAESTTAALPARNEKPVDKNFGREKRDRAPQRLEAYGYADMKANSVGRPFDGTKNNGARGKVGRLEQTLITKEEDSVHDSSTAPPIVFDRMSEMNRASSARAATGGIVGGPVAQARASAPAEAKGNSPHAPPPPSATAAASPSAASTAGTLGKLSSAAPSEERQNGRSGQVSGEVAAASEANEAAFGDQSAGARLNGQEPGKKKLADENVPVTAPARARRVLPRDDKQAVAQSLASSPSAASSNFSVEAKDQSDALIAGTAKLATASPTPMQWRIRGGKLQQSNDEGKTWREVNIPSPVSLRAFWSLGSSVWAGGTQGSLFRVTDDGKKSVQIPIKTGEGEVSQTVVAVTFSDELHGIITLENGQILQTADGGKTWERH